MSPCSTNVETKWSCGCSAGRRCGRWPPGTDAVPLEDGEHPLLLGGLAADGDEHAAAARSTDGSAWVNW